MILLVLTINMIFILKLSLNDDMFNVGLFGNFLN